MRGSEPDSHPLGRGGLPDRGGATRALGVALLAVGIIGLANASGSAATSSSPRPGAARRAMLGTVPASPVASAAHVLNVKDEGHLHSVSNSGAELLEEGKVSGTIPGKLKVSFDIGATVSAKFTIYANSGGSISGSGGGALHSTGVYFELRRLAQGDRRLGSLRACARHRHSDGCDQPQDICADGAGRRQAGLLSAPGQAGAVSAGSISVSRVASASFCSPARRPTNAAIAATAMIAAIT